MTPVAPDGIRGFAATAALCDLIVAADPATAAAYEALPDRRGAGVVVWDAQGGPLGQRLRAGLVPASAGAS